MGGCHGSGWREGKCLSASMSVCRSDCAGGRSGFLAEGREGRGWTGFVEGYPDDVAASVWDVH